MKRRFLPVLVLFVLLGPAAVLGQVFTASLTGAAEPGGGDTDGHGNATIFFNPAHTVMFVEVEVCNIVAPTASHIHQGAVGVNGGVFIGLGSAYDSTGRLRVVIPVTQQQHTAITSNPSNFYVNVHTTDFPGGAIRGQLSPAAAALTTSLLGSNEVGGGDTDGTGQALIVIAPTKGVAFVEIQVSNIGADNEIVGAHIHTGAAGVNGPILVDLKGADSFSGGVLRKIATFSSPDTGASILANPAGFYVNVHTSAFAGGAVRGQLEKLQKSGDADGDNAIAVSDIFYLINHLFAGGPPPP